ncbi:hypothetical protein BD410DRAFT_797116 [Rickenella mellea]|uniref:Uncharacterized protein n=1 Tax=Rickenella mellea TaxID=50990 RepID=A0A4Y7PGG9_9AGAM|nr:hypothetical protein BD410DRAFT_797116 [Rickenella mellea]
MLAVSMICALPSTVRLIMTSLSIFWHINSSPPLRDAPHCPGSKAPPRYRTPIGDHAHWWISISLPRRLGAARNTHERQSHARSQQ